MSSQPFSAAQERLLRSAGVEAQSHFLDIPAVPGRVHVLRSGEGPPVVMVPGFGDPAAIWAPLMAELDGFTLIAVDRPSFGLTGYVRHTTATIRALAVSFLEQVLDGLGLPHALFVASSVGSLWTMWLGLDRPERVTAAVHVGCPAFVLGTSAPLAMRLLSERAMGRLLIRFAPPSPKQIDRFASMVGVDLTPWPELRDLLVEAQKLPGARGALRELLHALVRPQGPRPEVVLTEADLAHLETPTLLIWGEDDVFGAPRVGERAVEILPDAELQVIDHEGHAPWIGHAEQVAAIALPFLLRHAGRAIDRAHRAAAPELHAR